LIKLNRLNRFICAVTFKPKTSSIITGLAGIALIVSSGALEGLSLGTATPIAAGMGIMGFTLLKTVN